MQQHLNIPKLVKFIKITKKSLIKLIFSEENGLKKLLFLEQALNRNKENLSEVFNNLLKYSFRDFKKFAIGTDEQSARADWVIKGTTSQTQKIKNECIYLEPKGIEIIWFNYDLNTNPEYKKLKTP